MPSVHTNTEATMVKFCVGATLATVLFIATFAVVTMLVNTHQMVSAGY